MFNNRRSKMLFDTNKIFDKNKEKKNEVLNYKAE